MRTAVRGIALGVAVLGMAAFGASSAQAADVPDVKNDQRTAELVKLGLSFHSVDKNRGAGTHKDVQVINLDQSNEYEIEDSGNVRTGDVEVDD